MNKKPKSHKRLWISLGCSLAVIGVICYALADRYLIRHVEAVEAEITSSAGSVETQSDESSIETESSSNTTSSAAQSILASVSTQTITSTAATSKTSASKASAVFTAVTDPDWSATTDEASIAIEKKVVGSGSSTITYYVAEVIINNGTALKSAFADGLYGRNIIEYTSTIAEDNNALFAINGDYYGFRSDGILIRNGVIYRDEPVRMGLAIYKDGSMKIYDETTTTAEKLLAAGVWQTLSFGPALVENGQVADFEGTISVDNNMGNHSIQGSNPRTGIGMIDENHFVFIVVDGRSSGYSKGMTLDEFAALFDSYGCTQAYNLDGGGSSTMVFQGEVINNPLGKHQERGTSDILYISE